MAPCHPPSFPALLQDVLWEAMDTNQDGIRDSLVEMTMPDLWAAVVGVCAPLVLAVLLGFQQQPSCLTITNHNHH